MRPRATKKAPRLTVPFDLEQLVEAARMAISPDCRQRAPRYGRLGSCVACHQPVHAHFDAAGGWLGCPAATEDAVFVLVPVSENGTHLAVQTAEDTPPKRIREFRVARYTPAIPKSQDIDALDLSDQRKRVLQAVMDAGKSGTRATGVINRSGLPHGSVQQALNWLRSQGLIDAREDIHNDGHDGDGNHGR